MAFVEVAANTLDDAFSVSNSCRFNDGDSPDLDITSSDGNEDIWTWSAWVKRSALKASGEQFLFCGSGDGSNNTEIKFQNDQFTYINFDGSSNNSYIRTTAKYRDVSAWYHLMVIIDMSQGTDTNRIKLYVNGVRNTTLDQTTYAGQNVDTYMNVASGTHRIGADARTAANYFDGYMAEMHFIDGTAKAHTDFGEFDEDSGIWKPKKYTGSYGTNGFYMEFKQTGTSANASGIGADTSGNGKHYTPANLAAEDICTDTPSNNFAVYDAALGLGGTLAEGNCQYQTGSSYANSNTAFSSIGINKGKWYAEFKVTATSSGNSVIGAGYDPEKQQDGRSNFCQEIDEGWGYAENGYAYNNGSTDLGTTYTTNDIVGVALDLDNDKIYWYKNNTLINSGGTAIDADKIYFFGVSDTTSGGQTTVQANFGNPPFSGTDKSDANSYGSFEYDPPTGFYALCTKNLAEYG